MYSRVFISNFLSPDSHRGERADIDHKLREFAQISQHLGADDMNVERSLLDVSQEIFSDATNLFTQGDYDRGHSRLRQLARTTSQYGPKHSHQVINFFTNISHAFGYYTAKNWGAAIKYLNPTVSDCPKVGENFPTGLTDALILLSESYAALGKFEDALLSARLAVTTAHSRLELVQKVSL